MVTEVTLTEPGNKVHAVVPVTLYLTWYVTLMGGCTATDVPHLLVVGFHLHQSLLVPSCPHMLPALMHRAAVPPPPGTRTPFFVTCPSFVTAHTAPAESVMLPDPGRTSVTTASAQ